MAESRTGRGQTGHSWPVAFAIVVAAMVASAGKCAPGGLVPTGLEIDLAGLGNPDSDLILEPDETVSVAPSWKRKPTSSIECYPTSYEVSGQATLLSGPVGGDYTI